MPTRNTPRVHLASASPLPPLGATAPRRGVWRAVHWHPNDSGSVPHDERQASVGVGVPCHYSDITTRRYATCPLACPPTPPPTHPPTRPFRASPDDVCPKYVPKAVPNTIPKTVPNRNQNGSNTGTKMGPKCGPKDSANIFKFVKYNYNKTRFTA